MRNEVGHHLMLLVTTQAAKRASLSADVEAKNKEVADLNNKVQTLQLALDNLQAKVNKLEKERSEQLHVEDKQLEDKDITSNIKCVPLQNRTERYNFNSIVDGESSDDCYSFEDLNPDMTSGILDMLTYDETDTCCSLPYDVESSPNPIRRIKTSRSITMFCNFRVKAFKQKQLHNALVTSVPFFTSNPGYRMALVIYPNGHGSCQGSHVSVFVQILHGPKDDQLVWPFYGSVTVKVSSSFAMDSEHIQVIESEGLPVKCFRRPTNYGDRNKMWGIEDFLCHTHIPYYIEDDGSMLFQVTRVTIPK